MSKQTHPHGEQLSAYLDGMLDVARMRSIAEHLRVCAPCREAHSQLKQTQALLRVMPEPTPPGPEFWTAAYRGVRVDDRERAASARSPWEAWSGPGHLAHRRWAAGLAATAAVAGALFAGPTLITPHNEVLPPPRTSVTLDQDVTPDVSALVESHTDSVSRLPLADPDRQKMIAADAQQERDVSEAAGNADPAF